MLYYDEVEIVNFFGSKIGKYKLGKFYDYLKSILFFVLIVYLMWLNRGYIDN